MDSYIYIIFKLIIFTLVIKQPSFLKDYLIEYELSFLFITIKIYDATKTLNIVSVIIFKFCIGKNAEFAANI